MTTQPSQPKVWEGRFIRSLLGLVFGLSDAAMVVGNHVLPSVTAVRAANCPLPTSFTTNEIAVHIILGVAAILLIHPQSLRELPGAIKASVPFMGRK